MNRICRTCQVREAANRKGPASCAECKLAKSRATKRALQSKYDGMVLQDPKIRNCVTCGDEFKTIHRRKCFKCVRVTFKDKHSDTYECPDCGGLMKRRESLRCKSCAYSKRSKENPLVRTEYPEKRKYLTSSHGYVLELAEHHPRANRAGYVFEHILVMEEMIGRRLTEGENVHHKNGVRSDNRPENLELWLVKQPAGQRTEDLVVWAKEILERYDG